MPRPMPEVPPITTCNFFGEVEELVSHYFPLPQFLDDLVDDLIGGSCR